MVSPIQAWTILRAEALGQPEALTAKAAFTAEENEELNAFGIHFITAGSEFMQEVEEELGLLVTAAKLDLNLNTWTITEAYQYLAAIKGSKYEQLHLTALLRVNNVALIWEGIRPA